MNFSGEIKKYGTFGLSENEILFDSADLMFLSFLCGCLLMCFFWEGGEDFSHSNRKFPIKSLMVPPATKLQRSRSRFFFSLKLQYYSIYPLFFFFFGGAGVGGLLWVEFSPSGADLKK